MEAPTIPAYHRALRAELEHAEPELWRWFTDAGAASAADTAATELELLKSAYRLDGDVHAALAGLAPVVAGRLGLDVEVVLYQALHESERNARVVLLDRRAHLVFGGDLLDLLDLREQEAVLAHELAHVWLHTVEAGAYLTLDHLVHRLDAESEEPALGETARRLRLHTEVWADRLALDLVTAAEPRSTAAAGDALDVVARSLVKVHAGIRHVDATAYLRQARQIVESDASASQGWTHPELHVRIACLAARSAAGADAVVAQFVDGADDLDRLDLLGRRRVQALTGAVLAGAVDVARAAAPDQAELDGALERHLAAFDGLRAAGAAPNDQLLGPAAPSAPVGPNSEGTRPARPLAPPPRTDAQLAGSHANEPNDPEQLQRGQRHGPPLYRAATPEAGPAGTPTPSGSPDRDEPRVDTHATRSTAAPVRAPNDAPPDAPPDAHQDASSGTLPRPDGSTLGAPQSAALPFRPLDDGALIAAEPSVRHLAAALLLDVALLRRDDDADRNIAGWSAEGRRIGVGDELEALLDRNVRTRAPTGRP